MLELLQTYQYPFLFVGLLLGGESVFLPAVYLALVGVFSFLPLIAIAAAATIISDTVWYTIGRFMPVERVRGLKVFVRHRETTEKLSLHFSSRALRILFFSKFVYGTRTVVQVLSGMHRIPYPRYILVNTSAAIVYLGFIAGLGFLVGESFDRFTDTLSFVKLFSVFLVVFILSSIWIQHVIRERWFR